MPVSAESLTTSPASQRRLPVAVLWDMDGTLVDTEPYWIASEFELAARHGATWTREDALRLVGRDLIEAAEYIRERMGLDVPPPRIVDELLDGVIARVREDVPWRPGARELLTGLQESGVPCALVTMSYRRFVDPILAGLPVRTFQAVVTGETVARGKPHPDPYLAAAAALGVDPAACIAIEDSTTGVTAAECAGCTVLVVPNHVRVEPGPRRVFRDSLAALTVDRLCALCDTPAHVGGRGPGTTQGGS